MFRPNNDIRFHMRRDPSKASRLRLRGISGPKQFDLSQERNIGDIRGIDKDTNL